MGLRVSKSQTLSHDPSGSRVFLALIRHSTGLGWPAFLCRLQNCMQRPKRTRVKLINNRSAHKTCVSVYLPSFSTAELAIISHKHSINQTHNHPSCIAHIPCDRVAHRPLRRSRTHPHHLPPQSRVVSLEKAASVSLPLCDAHANTNALPSSSFIGRLWNCAQCCCGWI